jgi:hypothetical protein
MHAGELVDQFQRLPSNLLLCCQHMTDFRMHLTDSTVGKNALHASNLLMGPCQLCQGAAPSQQIVTNGGMALLVCTACSVPARTAAIHGMTLQTLLDACSCGKLSTISPCSSMQDSPFPSGTNHLRAVGVSAMPGSPGLPALALSKPSVLPRANVTARGPRIRQPGVPEGYKCCNLCNNVQRIAAFQQSAKSPAKSYCHQCMPSVRRGMQMGIRMNKLRQLYQDGGLIAVQVVTGRAGNSGGKSTVEGGSCSTPTESLSP